MQMIPLADTGRSTTRLGYGCSALMGATGRAQSLRLLEAAFDAGIRHFDVAPMYGFGEAEECLGRFLARHKGDVTVTTKFGLAPARHRSLLNLARHLVGPLVKRVPAVKKRLARTAESVAGTGSRVPFTVAEAKASLERSLRLLRIDRIDVWLLHEARVEDLDDPRLLHFLQDQVRAGVVGAFGVGSDAAEVNGLLQERPAFCHVLQYEWSVLNSTPDDTRDAFRIHHRALTDSFRSLHAALLSDAELCAAWSRHLGCSLQNRDVLAKLMLKAALECNPHSIVLFSSKSADHMRNNVAASDDTRLREPAMKLFELIQGRSSLGASKSQAGANISRTSL